MRTEIDHTAFSANVLDDDRVEATLDETDATIDELATGLEWVQGYFERFSDTTRRGPDDIVLQFPALWETEGVYPIAETSHFFIFATDHDWIEDSPLTETQKRAVYAHHARVSEHELRHPPEENLPEGKDVPVLFVSKFGYDGNRGGKITYQYQNSGEVHVTSMIPVRGDAGILHIEQEWKLSKGRASAETSAKSVESYISLVEVYSEETDVEVPRSLQYISPSLPIQSGERLRWLTEHILSEAPLVYERVVDEVFTCEVCDSRADVENGKYTLLTDHVEGISHPYNELFEQVCTSCYAEQLAHGTNFSERQATIFTYTLMGFSHRKIQSELNKTRAEDEEITRGAVSGAMSAVNDKIEVAQRMAQYFPSD